MTRLRQLKYAWDSSGSALAAGATRQVVLQGAETEFNLPGDTAVATLSGDNAPVAYDVQCDVYSDQIHVNFRNLTDADITFEPQTIFVTIIPAAGVYDTGLTAEAGTDYPPVGGGGGGGGADVIARCYFDGDSVLSKNVGVASVDHTDDGSYTVNFTPGYFTTDPMVTVVCAELDGQALAAPANGDKDSQLVSVYQSDTLTDGAFWVIAIGT